MRIRTSGLIVALGIALSLSACSTATPQRSKSASKSDAVTTVRVGYITGGNYPLAEDVLIAGFEQAHPEYRIEKVNLETDIASAMTDFLRHQSVDAVFMNHSGADFGRSGLLTELSPYVQKSGFDLSRMAVGTNDLLNHGRLYALPHYAEPLVLYANTDLFKAAGVDLPKAGWTWDEFRETAARLTKRSDEVYGLSNSALERLTLMRLLQTTDGQPPWRASPETLKGTFQFFATLALTDRSATPLPRETEGPLQKSRDVDDFMAGKAAMLLGNLFPDLDVVPMPVAVLPVPVLEGRTPVLLSWFESVAIPANAPHPDLGWEFVQYAAGPEGAVRLAQNRILPMYMTPDVEDAWVRSNAPGGELIVKSHMTGYFGVWTDADMQLSSKLDDEINLALSGTGPWEQAVADFIAAAGTNQGK